MKIAIDPGHSGPYEPGACADGATEASVVMDIADLLGRILQETGAEVMLTRVGDIDDAGLIWRAEIANLWGADLFLSIHANSFANPAAHGTEVWHFAGSRSGIRLARAVQGQIIQKLHTVDRGVKPGTFTVLQATDCPAVLIETAFLSNPVDRVLLTSPAFQELFAAAIAAGIQDYTIG